MYKIEVAVVVYAREDYVCEEEGDGYRLTGKTVQERGGERGLEIKEGDVYKSTKKTVKGREGGGGELDIKEGDG